jgi:hypothetical protein
MKSQHKVKDSKIRKLVCGKVQYCSQLSRIHDKYTHNPLLRGTRQNPHRTSSLLSIYCIDLSVRPERHLTPEQLVLWHEIPPPLGVDAGEQSRGKNERSIHCRSGPFLISLLGRGKWVPPSIPF